MLIESVRAIISMWDRAHRNETIEIRFISPLVATFLASARLLRPNLEINIATNRRVHANQSGLSLALARNYALMSRAAQAGGRRNGQETSKVTWSRLTTLFHHAEIESCNQAINDLLFSQLEKLLPAPTLNAIAQVVGELHDNVASHAAGRGFSAAQFYLGGRGNSDRLELSVADGGRGFLRNVRAILPTIGSHEDAIRWCLQKGNTSTRAAKGAPFSMGLEEPDGESGAHQSDNHMGWGLWLLHDLVLSTGGELWIWAGDCSLVIRSNGEEVVEHTPHPWPGVLITLMFYPENAPKSRREPSDKLESLARELGL